MSDINITIEAGKPKRLKVAGTMPRKNIVVTAKDSHVPPKIATEAEMTALLETAEVGSVYKYTGAAGTYESGALYVVAESE